MPTSRWKRSIITRRKFSCLVCSRVFCSGWPISTPGEIFDQLLTCCAGPGESGKTTFLKQLKLVYNIAMTEAERSSFISSIKRNAAQSMQILVDRALNVYKTDLGSDEDKARAKISPSLATDLARDSCFVI